MKTLQTNFLSSRSCPEPTVWDFFIGDSGVPRTLGGKERHIQMPDAGVPQSSHAYHYLVQVVNAVLESYRHGFEFRPYSLPLRP